jgi:ATP-dependent DNA ligase
MPVVEEVMTIVRGMTDEERDELLRRLEELDEQRWQRERTETTRRFQAAGVTDDDIDETVRKLRYESRS